MNKRIKELMLEAGYAAPEIALRAQKLAELIVAECALAIQEEVGTRLYNEQQVAGLKVAKTVIKDRFGIE